MLVRQIRKLQLLCAMCLVMQLFFYNWLPIFHLIAVIMSMIVIANTKIVKCIDCRYNFYLIYLFIFRLMISNLIYKYVLLNIIYYVLLVYVLIILILITYHCLL